MKLSMTETYRGVGTASGLAFAYVGVAFLIAAGIAARADRLKPPTTPRKLPNRVLGLTLLGIWSVICGVWELPQMLQWVGFGLFFPLIALHAPAEKDKPGSRIAAAVFLSLTWLFWIFVSWIEGDRTITLTNDAVASSPPSFSHRSIGSAPRSNLLADLTISPGDWFMSPKPWTQWHFQTGSSTTENGIYVDGNQWYWGSHGLVTGDQVAKRIATWAGVAPTVHKEE